MSRPVAVLTSEVRIAGQLEPCVALILGSVSVIERMEPDYAVVDFNRAFRARSCSEYREEGATGNKTIQKRDNILSVNNYRKQH